MDREAEMQKCALEAQKYNDRLLADPRDVEALRLRSLAEFNYIVLKGQR